MKRPNETQGRQAERRAEDANKRAVMGDTSRSRAHRAMRLCGAATSADMDTAVDTQTHRRGRMKKMMAIAAMMVACGGAPEADVSEEHAAGKSCGHGYCFVDQVTRLETGICSGNSTTSCVGISSGSCVAGRAGSRITTDGCGHLVDSTSCALPYILCGGF